MKRFIFLFAFFMVFVQFLWGQSKSKSEFDVIVDGIDLSCLAIDSIHGLSVMWKELEESNRIDGIRVYKDESHVVKVGFEGWGESSNNNYVAYVGKSRLIRLDITSLVYDNSWVLEPVLPPVDKMYIVSDTVRSKYYFISGKMIHWIADDGNSAAFGTDKFAFEEETLKQNLLPFIANKINHPN